MASLGAAGADGSALRLRWSKYSSAYQARLLEGGRALRSFWQDRGISWRTIQKAGSRLTDEILEEFVRQKHSEKMRGNLRIAKHGVLWMQIVKPRLRRCLQGAWNALEGLGRTTAFILQTSNSLASSGSGDLPVSSICSGSSRPQDE